MNGDPRETLRLRRGDRIAQLVIQAVETAIFTEVDELPESVRATGGFGSTGGFGERDASEAKGITVFRRKGKTSDASDEAVAADEADLELTGDDEAETPAPAGAVAADGVLAARRSLRRRLGTRGRDPAYRPRCAAGADDRRARAAP